MMTTKVSRSNCASILASSEGQTCNSTSTKNGGSETTTIYMKRRIPSLRSCKIHRCFSWKVWIARYAEPGNDYFCSARAFSRSGISKNRQWFVWKPLDDADPPPHSPEILLLVVFCKKTPRAKANFYRGFIGSNFGIVSFLENVSIK